MKKATCVYAALMLCMTCFISGCDIQPKPSDKPTDQPKATIHKEIP